MAYSTDHDVVLEFPILIGDIGGAFNVSYLADSVVLLRFFEAGGETDTEWGSWGLARSIHEVFNTMEGNWTREA
jgi:hypothetical protein